MRLKPDGFTLSNMNQRDYYGRITVVKWNRPRKVQIDLKKPNFKIMKPKGFHQIVHEKNENSKLLVKFRYELYRGQNVLHGRIINATSTT